MLNISYYEPSKETSLSDAFKNAGFQTRFSNICDMLFLNVFLLESYCVASWLGLSSKYHTEEVQICSLWRDIDGTWHMDLLESDKYYDKIIECLKTVTEDIEINLTIHKTEGL